MKRIPTFPEETKKGSFYDIIGRRVKVDISKTKNKAIIKMMSPVEGMLLTPIKKITSPMGDNYYICAETKNKCIYEEVLVLQKGKVLKIELDGDTCTKSCPKQKEDKDINAKVGSLTCRRICKHFISWDEKRETITCGYEKEEQ